MTIMQYLAMRLYFLVFTSGCNLTKIIIIVIFTNYDKINKQQIE